MSDYRREKAAEIAKEEERKLEDIKNKVATGQATILAQAEQMEAILDSLDKGAEAERQLKARIEDRNVELNEVLQILTYKSTRLDEVKQDLTDKSYELAEVHQALTNKKNEVREQEQQFESIKENADEAMQKAKLSETLIDYFKDTNSGEREQAYFDEMLDIKYENECLKRENQDLKAENRMLKEKLNKA